MQLAAIRLRQHFHARGCFRLFSYFQSCLSGNPAAGVGSGVAASLLDSLLVAFPMKERALNS